MNTDFSLVHIVEWEAKTQAMVAEGHQELEFASCYRIDLFIGWECRASCRALRVLQVSCLVRLEDLDVSRNRLGELPAGLGRCTALRLMNAMANHLVAVPPQLGRLSSLYRLGLKSNR